MKRVENGPRGGGEEVEGGAVAVTADGVGNALAAPAAAAALVESGRRRLLLLRQLAGHVEGGRRHAAAIAIAEETRSVEPKRERKLKLKLARR